MNVVKHFNFPTFDDWTDKLNKKWYGKVGDYSCSISAFLWGEDHVTYVLAISTYEVPSNIYADTVHRSAISWNRKNIDELKNWYNTAIACANEAWEKFVTSNYLDATI